MDIKSNLHYTYRFEKWIAQLCLVMPFAKIADEVKKVTPVVGDGAGEESKKNAISESEIKKLFARWQGLQDVEYLERLSISSEIGIHKAYIGNKAVYFLTDINSEYKNVLGSIIWMTDNLEEIGDVLNNYYENESADSYPRKILADWELSGEIITFARKTFPYSEIVIDFKRIPQYMQVCLTEVRENANPDDIEHAIEAIEKYEEIVKKSNDEETLWRSVIIALPGNIFTPIWKCHDYIKNSLFPKRLETTDEYWDYIDYINEALECNYGCTVNAMRARIFYREKHPYDEEAAEYLAKQMTADTAARFLMCIKLYEERSIFPRFCRNVYTNAPSNPFINCEFNEIWEYHYGIPFITALTNLKNTILYHKAYDYFLEHTEEVLELLEKHKDNDLFDFQEDI